MRVEGTYICLTKTKMLPSQLCQIEALLILLSGGFHPSPGTDLSSVETRVSRLTVDPMRNMLCFLVHADADELQLLSGFAAAVCSCF